MKRNRLKSWRSLCIIAALAFLSNACISLKKSELIQPLTIPDYSQEFVNTERDSYRINYGDNLYLKVYSADVKTSKYFRSDFPELMNDSYIYLNSYKVDEEGYVQYSFIEKVKVKGLTIDEAQVAIQEAVEAYFDDVTVQIKLVNFQISILGEVKSPGSYNIDREQITLLQAISMAGGLNPFAEADAITLVRKSPNGSIVKTLDITDSKILESEYLFLLPDDVIYIKPRQSKSFGFEKFPYGLAIGIISFALSIYAITK
ncbi:MULTISPECIES: polysaccharide biosynthesis/export family protein [unclassified Carboxylicivirga]|uniref:polysaccharide biosynthesis/export family protein n=1 Tax=Carboxylicivirga TaxID=1628153 RepID=UPI003D326F60